MFSAIKEICHYKETRDSDKIEANTRKNHQSGKFHLTPNLRQQWCWKLMFSRLNKIAPSEISFFSIFFFVCFHLTNTTSLRHDKRKSGKNYIGEMLKNIVWPKKRSTGLCRIYTNQCIISVTVVINLKENRIENKQACSFGLRT